MPWHKANGAIAMFKTIGVDLTMQRDLPALQELMLHRHLYAHHLGVVDDQYLAKLKALTGRDLRSEGLFAHYPVQDSYWFEPLGRLNAFIEAVRSFWRELPDIPSNSVAVRLA
jgi:hypothetical protein